MSSRQRPVILILSDYYLPGFKSGGGMRTIVNMVDQLSHKYDFRIITRDHDGKLDKKQYETVKINEWNRIRNADVFYVSKDKLQIGVIKKLIEHVGPDSIYVNSVFSTLTIYLLILRRLGLIERVKVVVASCGELSESSLGNKGLKKRLYLGAAKVSGLYSNIIWKASTEIEAGEVRDLNPSRAKIFVAPDMPAMDLFSEYDQNLKPLKNRGEASFVFLSRYVRTKNFNWILPLMKNFDKAKIRLDMIGPIEHPDYWEEAQELIAELPANVTVRAVGPVDHEKVCEVLSGYHFFISATVGENFGHVFMEAMAAGCPIVISNTTPWIDLEKKGVGWDIPLDKPDYWIETLKKCIDMDNEEYVKLSTRARAYACEWLAHPALTPDNEVVLDYSLNGKCVSEKQT